MKIENVFVRTTRETENALLDLCDRVAAELNAGPNDGSRVLYTGKSLLSFCASRGLVHLIITNLMETADLCKSRDGLESVKQALAELDKPNKTAEESLAELEREEQEMLDAIDPHMRASVEAIKTASRAHEML